MLAIWPFQGRRVLISVPTPQRSGSAGLAGGNSRGPALPSWGRCLGPLSTLFVGGLPPQRLRSPTWCVPSPSSGPEGDKHKGQGQVAFLPDPLGGRALEPPLCMQHTGGGGAGKHVLERRHFSVVLLLPRECLPRAGNGARPSRPGWVRLAPPTATRHRPLPCGCSLSPRGSWVCLHRGPAKAGGLGSVNLAGDSGVPGTGGLPAPAWLLLVVRKV